MAECGQIATPYFLPWMEIKKVAVFGQFVVQCRAGESVAAFCQIVYRALPAVSAKKKLPHFLAVFGLKLHKLGWFCQFKPAL